jgi:hypothetical protein
MHEYTLAVAWRASRSGAIHTCTNTHMQWPGEQGGLEHYTHARIHTCSGLASKQVWSNSHMHEYTHAVAWQASRSGAIHTCMNTHMQWPGKQEGQRDQGR